MSRATGGAVVERLLIQGAPVPLLRSKDGERWLVWGYVDDFGALGLKDKRETDDQCEVSIIYIKIRLQLRSSGLGVHKEMSGSEIQTLGVLIGRFGRWNLLIARPTEEKRQLLEEATIWFVG